MLKLSLLKRIIQILLFTTPIVCLSQEKHELENWIKKNTIVMQNNNELDFSQFKGFENYFKNKTIIGLGEPTHGTSEAQILRMQLLKLLVEKFDYRTIALEAIDNCEGVNDFILYGKGSSDQAVKAMGMWMFGTEETERLLSWIRSYNQEAVSEKKIRFYGIDVMYKLNTKYFRDSLGGKQIISDDLLNSIDSISDKYLGKQEAPPKNKMIILNSLVLQLQTLIEKNRSEIEKKVSENYFKFSIYACRTFLQAITPQLTDKNKQNNYRDSCMVENIKYVSLNFSENKKIMVGNHNGHIQYGKHINTKTTGSFLREMYKDQYYNIGVEFITGSFRSLIWDNNQKKYVMNINEIIEPKKKSLGYALKGISMESFFIDFKNAEKDLIFKKLFATPRPSLAVGWLFSPKYPKDYYSKKELSSLYDGLFYIRNTSETRFLNKNP